MSLINVVVGMDFIAIHFIAEPFLSPCFVVDHTLVAFVVWVADVVCTLLSFAFVVATVYCCYTALC
jgi:hypothetical protein